MNLRNLPSVDHLLHNDTADDLITIYGRPLTIRAIRHQLETARAAIRDGAPPPADDDLLDGVRAILTNWMTPSLRPVINATGVIIHTNLGRAPLSRASYLAMLAVAEGYSSLEYNLPRGKRGTRQKHAEELLIRITDAEAGLVVNNNAAAVLLTLTALARRKEVLISRSQLVEIGGGFRIPDIMKQSGAKLVEVGTTNRTHLHDFESAIHERTGLILRVHHSNFKIIGFTTEPSLEELVELGNRHDVPVVDDIGSGALLDTAQYGLGHEPMVQESLQSGALLVAFSGDKLLGGPQAGIIVGQKRLVDRLRRHPLARAIRSDKLCLTALIVTLTHYLKDEALKEIPVWQMIAAPTELLRIRAEAWATELGQGEVIQGRSTVGGGSLPEETLLTWLLTLKINHPNAFTSRLRLNNPPVIARIENDRVVLDPRTVMVWQDESLLRVLKETL